MHTTATLPALAVLLLAGFRAPPRNDAEALYRRMEKALSGSKGVDIKVESKSSWSLDGVSLDASMTSRFLFQEQGRLRVEMSGSVKEIAGDRTKAFKVDLVSDGKRYRLTSSGTGLKPKAEGKAIAGLRPRLESLLIPSPIIFLSDSLGEEFMSEQETFVDTNAGVSEFRLAGREKIDGADTRRLTYLLSLGAEGYAGAEYRVDLWIDAATGLPVRRETFPAGGDSEDRITETFHVVRDPKVDPKRFEVPQEE